MSDDQAKKEAKDVIYGCFLITVFGIAVFSVVVFILALGVKVALR